MTDLPRHVAAVTTRPAAIAGEDAFAALTALLWHEREILEVLLYRLVQQQLVLASGNTRWLPKADAEVREAAEAVQEHEVVRAAEVDMLVRTHGMPSDISLRELAETAPEPWPTVLLDHRESLRALTLEIETTTAENRRLLVAGEQATREALERATGQSAEPPSRGYGARSGVARAFLLDERA